MKKFTIVALAICLAFALAAPAMAVDANFSGYQFVRGIYVDQWDMNKNTPNDAFMNMRFRLQTVFKVSDILSVTTRFDALDGHVFGTTDDQSTGAGNIDFDRAYMTIKAPIGTFDIGRKAGGTFGTTFVDSDTEADRIQFTKVMGNLKILALLEKVAEADSDTTTNLYGDKDTDKWVIAPIYKMENITAGLLVAFINDKSVDDATIRKYAFNPYFVGKFGPVAVQGEISYTMGDKDYDLASTTDMDYKQLAYNVEASFNLGPASIMLGYAFVSGEDTDANQDTGAGGVGNDWEKLFILTTNEVPALVKLGGYGNLSKDGVTNMGTDLGAKIIYGGASFSPLDNLTLGIVVGNATADELQSGKSKDDYGTEYDFTLNWKIYDNLTYTAIAAFLSAGDLYKEQGAIADADFDDTYALFHQLMLTF